MLKFATGNKSKYGEVKILLAPLKIERANIDLKEIQELDPRKIIAYKLQQAFERHRNEFIVEDVSLSFDCLAGKLPGPLIRWFNEALGNELMVKLTKRMGNTRARLKVIIGYAKNPRKVLFFESEIKGTIVEPRGGKGFGFDSIFLPKGSSKTLAELKDNGDFHSSARGQAIAKLKNYLIRHEKY